MEQLVKSIVSNIEAGNVWCKRASNGVDIHVKLSPDIRLLLFKEGGLYKGQSEIFSIQHISDIGNAANTFLLQQEKNFKDCQISNLKVLYGKGFDYSI